MSVLSVSMLRRWHVVCAAAVMLCAMGAARAQSSDDTAGDPPNRVARLSYLDGDIGLLPAGAQDWGAAEINRPLTRGDKLSSGPDARAELELDGSTLRIDRQTRFGFLELNDDLAQVELTQGTLNLAVRQLGEGQSYEIDTPTLALVVDQPGTFRVDVGDDGQSTMVTALDGDATVYGENGTQREVRAGRSYTFQDPALRDVALNDVRGGDAFDAWSNDRDRRYAQPASSRYVSEDVVGYQDLDRYGDWQSNTNYGQVWYPSNVASDWAPYRDGHWSYIAPWGWTWVDESPWGFAPYHYGRWAYIGNAWGWVPGPGRVRPIYAPALVAFVGGSHWNVSVDIGGAPVGWFPLGPGEVYNPWYRSSRRYYTQVNVTNINVRNRTVIINRIDRQYDGYRRGLPVRGVHYANREAPHGFTAVPGRSFVGARRVKHDLLRVDPRQLANAPMLGRAGAPRPIPRSIEPPGPVQLRPHVRKGFEREVVARHAPPPIFAAGTLAPHPRGTSQAGAPARPLHVRLLAGHDATLPAVRRIEPGTHRPEAGKFDEPATQAPGYRTATRPTPGQGRFVRDDAPAHGSDMDPGELPSARFVRSRREASYSHDTAQPAGPNKPRAYHPAPSGVSFISGSSRDSQVGQPPATNAAGTLPPPRIFQRAANALVTDNGRAQRIQDARQQRERGMRDDASPPQRFGQGNHMGNSMRAPDFSRLPPPADRPQRFDRPPTGYQPPRGYGPPRPMPQGFAPPVRAAERPMPAPAAPAAQPARRAPAASESGKPLRRGEFQH